MKALPGHLQIRRMSLLCCFYINQESAGIRCISDVIIV